MCPCVLALVVADVLTLDPVLVARGRARLFAHPCVHFIKQVPRLTLTITFFLTVFVEPCPAGAPGVAEVVSGDAVRMAIWTPAQTNILTIQAVIAFAVSPQFFGIHIPPSVAREIYLNAGPSAVLVLSPVALWRI